jgi:hypothetical protein
MIFTKINDIEGVSFLLIVMSDIKVSSGANISYVILCSVYIMDCTWFRQFKGRDAEILDYVRGYEIVSCTTVNQGTDFRVKCPRVECYKGMNGSLIWEEYSLWK